jgi:hypothetical protein
MSTITIKIPEYLREQVERLSASEGFTVDQFFATAASEKLSVICELDYIRTKATNADDQEFLEALKHIPDAPVAGTWDHMPEAAK